MTALNIADVVARVRVLQSELGLNQRALADMIEVSQANISKIFSGQITLTDEMRDRFAAGVIVLEQRRTALNTAMAKAVSEAIDAVDTKPVSALRAEINERFEVIDQIVGGVIHGDIPAVIISGPAGLGKSHNVIRMLRESGKDYDIISGSCTAAGLYQALYNFRNGGIVLIDDCDSVFDDEDAMNQLKKATDTNVDARSPSWRKLAAWVYNGTDEDREAEIEELTAQAEALRDSDKEGDEKRAGKVEDEIKKLQGKFPNTFDFNGKVIFISNLDFMGIIEGTGAMAEHMKALVNRGFYIDLDMNTVEKKVDRIMQAIEEFDLLGKYGVSAEVVSEIKAFIMDNADKFQTLSFRTAEKIAALSKTGPKWKRAAAITQFKARRG